MLVMVLSGTFHQPYERGLLGNVPQKLKSIIYIQVFWSVYLRKKNL